MPPAAAMSHDDDMNTRIARVETHVGLTEGEGLRGDMNEVKRAVQGLWKHIYIAMGGAALGLWAVEHLFLAK